MEIVGNELHDRVAERKQWLQQGAIIKYRKVLFGEVLTKFSDFSRFPWHIKNS